MQFIVISHQLWEILAAATLGIFLGLVYDGVRFIRRLLSPIGKDIIFANIFDILYFVFAGAAYCVFLYVASNGRFRWFTALALALGFIVYRLLPGRLIKTFVYFSADLILRLLAFLLTPLRVIKKLSAKAFGALFRLLKYRMLLFKTERMRRQLHRDVRL